MTYARVRRIGQVIIGIALLAWLLSSLDLDDVAAALRRSDPLWIAAGSAAFAAAVVPAGLRLRGVLRRQHLPFGWALRLTLASLWFHQMLPTGLGGDGYRALRLKDVTGSWATAIALLAFERTAGALALLVPALIYAVGRYGAPNIFRELGGHLPGSGAAATWWTLAAAVLLITIVALRVPASDRLRRPIRDALVCVRSLSPAAIRGTVLLSLGYHALRLLGMAAFLAAVGYRVAPGDLMVIMALALLGSLVPVSAGALGVREGLLVYGFAAYGVPHAEGFTVAVLSRLALVVLGLCGAIAFSIDGRTAGTRRTEEPGGCQDPTASGPQGI